MPLDWSPYDGFGWSDARQQPMPDRERETVEALAADVLGLPQDVRATRWGAASPPGRFAATVVQVADGLPTGYGELAERAGISSLGVKIFKGSPDARREAGRVIPFHLSQLRRLPGLPHPRVPMSVAAAFRADGDGVLRGVIVQEWMQGLALDHVLQQRKAEGPGALPERLDLVRQMLEEIVVPLWSAGTVWWDIRDANFCYAPDSQRLRLIDVDSLGAYADEILDGGGSWARRDKGRATALPRLRRTVSRLLALDGLGPRSHVDRCLNDAWRTTIEPVLLGLGHDPGATAEAPAAIAHFCATLSALGPDRETP